MFHGGAGTLKDHLSDRSIGLGASLAGSRATLTADCWSSFALTSQVVEICSRGSSGLASCGCSQEGISVLVMVAGWTLGVVFGESTMSGESSPYGLELWPSTLGTIWTSAYLSTKRHGAIISTIGSRTICRRRVFHGISDIAIA